jgi:hypothetical protein
MSLIEHYSDTELMVIAGYMENMSEMTERLMTDVVATRSDG